MTTLRYDVLWNDRGAERGMRNLGQATDKTSGRMRGLKVAGAAALAAVGVAAVKFGADSVRAYVAAESSQVRLQNAFQKFPKLADTNIGSLRKLNTELARKTRFDDDATASGQAALAQFNLTGKQITALTPLMQDYAAKTGKDLPTAAKDLGRAVLGQGRALKVVGLDLKDTGSATGNLNQLMGGLRKQVGGFATAEGKTAAGQAEILKNQFGELQETAGQKLLPALMKIGGGLLNVVTAVQDGSGVFGTFKRIVSATFGSFSESVGLGRVSFRGFADFVQTHQADITRGFVAGGKIVLAFGQAFAIIGSTALRSFAFIADGQADMVQNLTRSFRHILTGAVIAFGWIPGVGQRLKEADAKFASFSDTAVGGLRRAAAGARTAADGIDNKLRPALDRAGRKLDEVGRKEIWTAKNRDAAKAASIAIRDIGVKADGSQVKLKSWNERTRLGSVEQGRLERQIKAARQKMIEQRTTAILAGDTQAGLTKRWNQGRDALYRQFRQMGLSKAEAVRLAKAYGDVPKHLRVKHETPGSKQARAEMEDLRRRIGLIKSRTAWIKFSTNAAAVAKTYGVSLATFRGSTAAQGGPRARGGILPGNTPLARGDDIAFPMANGGIQPLRGGEGIAVTEAMRNPYERARLLALNKAALRGESLRRFQEERGDGLAAGGTVRVNVQRPDTSWVRRAGDMQGEALAKTIAARIGGAVGTALRSVAAAASATTGYTSPGKFGRWSAEQMRNAATIASVGSSMGRRAQTIGIATAIVESGLRNLGFGDRDSVGLFQQRTPWGSRAARMNPRISAGMFFHGGRGGQRGLDDVPWRQLSMGRAAQAVQVSAFPGRYQTQVANAVRILNALSSTGPSGGGGPVGGALGGRGRQGARAAGLRLGARSVGTYPGHHPSMNRAWDFMTGSKGTGDRIAAHLWAHRKHYNLWYLIWWRRIISMTRPGSGWLPYRRSNPHTDHVHASFYDRGGRFRQGTAAINRRGGTERILTERQNKSFERMVSRMDRGSGGGATYNVTISAPNYIGSQQDLVNTMVQMAGRGQMNVVLRKAGVPV